MEVERWNGNLGVWEFETNYMFRPYDVIRLYPTRWGKWKGFEVEVKDGINWYDIGNISNRDLEVLADFRKAELDGVRSRGGYWAVFTHAGHANKYAGHWYRHAKKLERAGFIDYSPGLERWRLTAYGRFILKKAVEMGIIDESKEVLWL